MKHFANDQKLTCDVEPGEAEDFCQVLTSSDGQGVPTNRGVHMLLPLRCFRRSVLGAENR